jgi:hypothetical protein
MTATTTKLGTGQAKHILEALRRAALGTRRVASALGSRWSAALASGQLGPDPETTIGRATGARI